MPNISGQETVIALRGGNFKIPDGYDGYVDSEEPLHGYAGKTIASVHDYEKTPPAEKIISELSSKKGDIVKGAYAAKYFAVAVFSKCPGTETSSHSHRNGRNRKITRVDPDCWGEATYCHMGTPPEGSFLYRKLLNSMKIQLFWD